MNVDEAREVVHAIEAVRGATYSGDVERALVCAEAAVRQAERLRKAVHRWARRAEGEGDE